jgi:hypothetical protein
MRSVVGTNTWQWRSHCGIYSFVRQDHSLGTTAAVAAGLEEKPWSLENVVEMTEAIGAKRNDGRIAELR